MVSSEKNKAVYESVEVLKESGGVGYAESAAIKADMLNGGDSPIPFAGVTFKRYSDKTPTKEELNGATVITTWGTEEEKYVARWSMEQVAIDSDVMYSTVWCKEGIAFQIVILAAYKTGTHTINYGGYDIPVDIPKTGLYIPSFAIELPDTWTTVDVDISWKTIHKIKPEFLPEGGVGYTGTGNVLLPTMTASFSAEAENMIPHTFELVEGKRYTVNWNGIDYTTTCVSYDDALFIGNTAPIGGDDTGEPFLIVPLPEAMTMVGVMADCEVTLSISEEKVVHKINEEYIPFPFGVVEIPAFPTTEISADVQAKLDFYAENVMPLIVKLTHEGVHIATAFFACGNSDGTICFTWSTRDSAYELKKIDSKWTAKVTLY